ncbi:MAG: glycoside hydrolase family 28 protein, partial [Prevotellaceae bacterium]|nr:glycoside hydrolase family 28 protein [Prevotellaceae bacterium]
MKKTIITFLAIVAANIVALAGNNSKQAEEERFAALAETVARPNIPDYSVNIKDFNGDFNKAMKALALKGGGRLIVPAGIWNTAPIEFESNCELHVESGALVLFTSD